LSFFFCPFAAPPISTPLPLPAALPLSARRNSGSVRSRRRPRLTAARLRLASSRRSLAPRLGRVGTRGRCGGATASLSRAASRARSEEHTSELQSRGQLVCRLLLEKKKK